MASAQWFCQANAPMVETWLLPRYGYVTGKDKVWRIGIWAAGGILDSPRGASMVARTYPLQGTREEAMQAVEDGAVEVAAETMRTVLEKEPD